MKLYALESLKEAWWKRSINYWQEEILLNLNRYIYWYDLKHLINFQNNPLNSTA